MAEDTAYDKTLEFHLDCFLNNCIMGWVRDSVHPDRAVNLQLCLGSRRISAQRADQHRPDLEAEGLGSGCYGFKISVPAFTMEAAENDGEMLTIVAMGYSEAILYRIDLNIALDMPSPLTEVLADRLDASRASPGRYQSPCERPRRCRRRILPCSREVNPPSAVAPALFPYAEHVRVMQQGGAFSPVLIASDFDHFLRWYLDRYNVSRAPLRAPLSKDVNVWRNEFVVIGGMPFNVTRVMLWYLATERGGDLLRSLSDETAYRKLAYWWAGDRAPALSVEDCLVPQSLIDDLRAVSPACKGQAFPLSRFMEEGLISRPSLGCFGLMHSLSARVTAYLVLIVEALDEPGLLRFVPKAVRGRLFDGEAPLFDDLAAANSREPEALAK